MIDTIQAHLAPAAAPDPAGARVRVWDLFIRLFHWTLVAAVLTAWFTEDDLLGLHTWAGYTVMALIGARLLWGLVGPRHARWSDFVRGPRATLAYLGDALRGHATRHLGHNPAGAVMVVALLVGLTATAVTGVMLLGAGEGAGPLAATLQGFSPAAAHDLEVLPHDQRRILALGLLPKRISGDKTLLPPGICDRLEAAILGMRGAGLEGHHPALTRGHHDRMGQLETLLVEAIEHFQA